MRVQILMAAAAAALSVAACQPAADETVVDNAEDEVVVDSDTALDTPIVLSAEGLSAGTGELIALGASYEDARGFAMQALGDSPVEDTNNDCPMGPAGYAHFVDAGLTLLFRDEALIGWESTGAGLTTGYGIHAGSTVEELRAAYPAAEIQETTLPSNVFILEDGLYGPLNEDETAIVSIRSGQNCDAT